MKRPFLAVYDYGMGGIWAYVWADSPEAIEAKFDAQVVDELPTWLNGHNPGVVSFDIDIDDPPPGWLP